MKYTNNGADEHHECQSQWVNRRQIVLGTGTAAVMAGCASGGENRSTTNSNQRDASTAYSLGPQPDWGSVNMNPFSPTGHSSVWDIQHGYWFNLVGVSNWVPDGGTACPIQYEAGWPKLVDPCTVEYKFREDGGTWWDGTDITIRDGMYTKWTVQGKILSENDPIDLEIIDDYTMRRHTDRPRNPQSVDATKGGQIWFKHDYWSDVIEEAEDITTESARRELSRKVLEKRISPEEFMNQGLGNGLYRPTEITAPKVINEKHDGHMFADRTNVEREIIYLSSERQKGVSLTQNQKVDVGYPKKHPGKGDSVTKLSEFGTFSGQDLRFNWRRTHPDRRAFRRAVAYLMPRNQIRQLVQERGTPVGPSEVTTGAKSVKNITRLTNDEKFHEQLIQYGEESNEKKASAVLREAGYSKRGNVWVGPDGNRVELTYITPNRTEPSVAAKLLSSVFENFGFKNDLLVLNGSQYQKQFEQTHEWDIAQVGIGARDPGWLLYTVAGEYDDKEGKYGGPVLESDWKWPESEECELLVPEPTLLQDREPRYHQPIRADFPKQIGQEEIDGETYRYDPFEYLTYIKRGTRNQFHETMKKLLWYWNWQLPLIDQYHELARVWGNTEKFEYTFEDDCRVKSPTSDMPWTRSLKSPTSQ